MLDEGALASVLLVLLGVVLGNQRNVSDRLTDLLLFAFDLFPWRHVVD